MTDEYVRPLSDIGRGDTSDVGGKSANLGELARLDVPVLPGFSTTSTAYDRFLSAAGIEDDLRDVMADLDTDDVRDLGERGKRARELIREATIPEDVAAAVANAYARLGDELEIEDPAVAVRSSATAEDLPGASFAGQQETFLDVAGEEELLEAVRGCYESLFTDRAISYREDQGFSHFDVKLSVIVQKLGRSDLASSGVTFTIDPDTGFENVVVVEAAYGLGELVVQGEVTPDEYVVFKPTGGVVDRRLGDKDRRLVLGEGGPVEESVPRRERERFALEDDQVAELATYARRIEDHYGQPMDVEWLLDGELDRLFVVQARPETVHAGEPVRTIRSFRLTEDGEVLVEGLAIGNGIGAGRVRILGGPGEMDRFEEGDVLVTGRTDPDWEPIMKKAAAIVTDRGGKTSHAAIVSRELGVPAVVGAETATKVLRDGEAVTVDCTGAAGAVYEGLLEYEVDERELESIPQTETDVMLVLGDPGRAFALADLPVDGVGLAREEFVVTSRVGAHPLYLLDRGEGERFVEALRGGIATIAAAFHPNDVIVRLSDFKSDEYRNLEGGRRYEPEEANPMLGWRGAARYYDERFREAFRLECEALRRVREDVGLDNVTVMVPFCRTPEEGERVRSLMGEFGLDTDELDVYVMAELPSNVLLADRFSEGFAGFSIGSNDLTQLILGVDRNSERLAALFDESNEAVRRAIRELIDVAHEYDRRVGICGDAPSTVEGYVEFLVDSGIDSISVSPDVALEAILTVAEAEENATGRRAE
ncbi:MAG: phosphoenolpyruvate synthase [Salinigranum sp.]